MGQDEIKTFLIIRRTDRRASGFSKARDGGVQSVKMRPGQHNDASRADAPALAGHGGHRDKIDKNQVDKINLPKGGTSADYLAARIKRDHPEIAARIDEFPSVRAAAKAAGIVKDPDVLKSIERQLCDDARVGGGVKKGAVAFLDLPPKPPWRG
jgi:hypothetical protein